MRVRVRVCVCVYVCVYVHVCEAPLDDWTNGVSVSVFSAYGEYVFSSMGILRTKLRGIASRK